MADNILVFSLENFSQLSIDGNCFIFLFDILNFPHYSADDFLHYECWRFSNSLNDWIVGLLKGRGADERWEEISRLNEKFNSLGGQGDIH